MGLILGNLDCKVLTTQDIQVEVSFEVMEGNPDFVEVYAYFADDTHAKVDIKSSEGVTQYKTTLKLLLRNARYTIACCPRKIDSNGQYVDHYEEDGINVYWESYCIYKYVIIPLGSYDANDTFPIPLITQVVPYPKRISSKSGALISWWSAREYSRYELLIRVPGIRSYDIIDFDISNNAYTYNLLSQHLSSTPIDFIMSDLNNPHTFEIQLRGIQPAALQFPTYYSKWSNVFSFKSANALNSVKAFFDGHPISNGIRQYLPQGINVSLRNKMHIDEI
ncbi:MAG: hypothetical protein J0I84_06970 [Terrimonas sp.]|nr:hypothetical protein [Terrimonas sp.]